MGVIDLDARVKKLEQDAGGGAVIDQLEAAVTALEETVNGDGETDLGLVGDVAAIQSELTPVQETITPSTGTAGSGGCFYKVYGNVVSIHLNVTGLTKNTWNQITVLSESVRPEASVIGYGIDANLTGLSAFAIVSSANGNVNIVPSDTSAIVDITYIIPTSTTPTE